MRQTTWMSLCAAGAVGLWAHNAMAQAYSTEGGGPSGNAGAGIEEKNGTTISNAGGGAGMGAGAANDEIDSISGDSEDDEVTLCFSVDPFSQGSSLPRIPTINVLHQANRRQAAGDAFIGTEAWQVDTGRIPGASLGFFDNALVTNQGRGWVDSVGFGLLPNSQPQDFLPPATPTDNVNGLAQLRTRGGGAGPPELFYTLRNGSDSLLTLPGANGVLDRGSDIFYDDDITNLGSEQLFAQASDFGLQPGDDIDGLIVMDRNDDRAFDPGDLVFFSLSPGSPSLGLVGASPADIFRATLGGFNLFISHAELGLLPSDNLDAIHFDMLINGSARDTIDAKTPAPGTGLLVAMAGLGLAGRRRRAGL